jgi:hypothetical protein
VRSHPNIDGGIRLQSGAGRWIPAIRVGAPVARSGIKRSLDFLPKIVAHKSNPVSFENETTN